MRNISFSMTKKQIRARTKFVTRRLGWWNLQPGDRLCAIEKGQGLKKGEKVKRLAIIEVLTVRRESLHLITKQDCKLEGFPGMSPRMFVAMFIQHNKCDATTMVNRIQFKYVDD